MSPPLRHLCLVRLSALGDVVLVLPLVRHLQRHWPHVKLTWICGRAVYPVLQGLEAEGVELVPIDKPRTVADYWRLRRQFRDREFDAVLCLQASWRANWLYPCLRAKRKIGYGADRAKDLHRWFVREVLPPAAPHLVDGFLQFAEALGLPWPETVEWRLPVSPEAEQAMAPRLPSGSFAVVNACASKPERDWPAERLTTVLRWLQEAHSLPAVLIGGPSPREQSVATRVALEVPGTVNLVGQTRLPEMVAVLKRARVVLAPDTGAVHLANALGRPVVGLYAVAPADRTGPYGNLDYTVDVFSEALQTFLGRRREDSPWSQRVHHPAAMRLITVEAVQEKLQLLLSRQRQTRFL